MHRTAKRNQLFTPRVDTISKQYRQPLSACGALEHRRVGKEVHRGSSEAF